MGLQGASHSLDISPRVTAPLASTLLDCLADPYDSNKTTALALLRLLPPSLLLLQCPTTVARLLADCTRLAASPKPPDCLTASAQVLANTNHCFTSL